MNPETQNDSRPPSPTPEPNENIKANESKVEDSKALSIVSEISRWKKFRTKIDGFLEHNITIVFMTFITLYALFGDDIRQLVDDKSYDDGFFAFSAICLGLFTLEIILSCFAKPGYFLGFFFWLDIISSASLILDIGWISDPLLGTGSNTGATSAQKLAKAGRASRIGTRAGRIVRVVRLIRLIRIVKLYKAAHSTLEQAQLQQAHTDFEDNDPNFDDGFLAVKSGSNAGMNHQNSAIKPEGGSAQAMFERRPRNDEMSLINSPSADRNTLRKASDLVRNDGLHNTLHNTQGGPPSTDRGIGRKTSDAPIIERSPLRISTLEMARRSSNDIAVVRKPSENTAIIKKPSDSEYQLKKKSTIEVIQTKLPAEPLVHSGEIIDHPKDSARLGKTSEVILSRKLQRAQTLLQKSQTKNFEIPQETNVGKKLSTLTTKRVITLVMSVMISIPIFSVDTYLSDLPSAESGIKSLYHLNTTGDSYSFELAASSYIREHESIRNPIFILNVLGDYKLQTVLENSLRESEKQYYYAGDTDDLDSDSSNAYSCFDLRDDTHLNAILGIARTLFVTAVLTGAALLFSKDSNDLVLSPIENMLMKVKRIAENPLAAAQIEEEDALINENLEKEGKLAKLQQKKDEKNYETNILEKTILKLGALLAIGFGEAGSNIIAQNMAKSGDVDPMIPGKKIMGIFCFCDIRQFTGATEVLQEGVMVFVNEIAEIVHGTINDFSGAANKNIGDVFFLVWKFPEEEVESDPDDPSILRLKQSTKVSALADMSVVSCLKVLAGISKSKKLDKYRHNEGLNQIMKNFSVKMGFGLHAGWAIEGAIGSEYKIDASYLSPNVNISARLEAATKQFGVPILISGTLYGLCTEETKRHLRHIDKVKVKGSDQPVDLFTCDLDFNRISVDKNEVDNSNRTAAEKRQARVESRLKKEDLKEKAYNGKLKISKKFNTDKDLVALRKPFTREFAEKFKDGVDNYIAGNWGKARDCFEATLKMISSKEKDGPSNTLLNFMSEYGFRAPHDWKGCRTLTEK